MPLLPQCASPSPLLVHLHVLTRSCTTAAEFRLIVFRPYIGEAILGKVKSQSQEGIVGASLSFPVLRALERALMHCASAVTVGFFDDIVIPPSLLPDYSC